MTLLDIAVRLGSRPSTVFGWISDLPRPPRDTWRPRTKSGPNKLERVKAEQIAECREWASTKVGQLSDEAFFAAGIALYAGEGSKTDGAVKFANMDPRMVSFFCAWLRRYFAVDESRLRACVYLHADLDYDAAIAFWSDVAQIPPAQFTKAYRAERPANLRKRRHPHGCMYVSYHCSLTHRTVMALCEVLLSFQVAGPA
jgi:hypothetical protein